MSKNVSNNLCDCGAPVSGDGPHCIACAAVLEAAREVLADPIAVTRPEAGLPVTGSGVKEFMLVEFVGMGSVCAVYRGEPESRKPHAIRFLRPSRINERNRERFRREAELLSRVDHPNIPKLFRTDEWEGVPYMVMEFVQGRDLKKVLREDGPLEPRLAVTIMLEVCEALHAVHKAGALHRDVRPRNIVLDGNKAWLLDFGFSLPKAANRLTPDGRSVGTPAYMSPEAAAGIPMGPRSDVWSVGVTLFELLTGELPFYDPVPVKLMEKVVYDEPADLRSHLPDAPQALASVVARCLQKGPSKRYGTPREVAVELAAVLRELG